MECIFSRYENRSHIEIRNWTVAGYKRCSYNCTCSDGNRKVCQQSITPFALDKGHGYYPVCEMTAAQRHVSAVIRRRDGRSGGKLFQQTGNNTSHNEMRCFLTARQPSVMKCTIEKQFLEPLAVAFRWRHCHVSHHLLKLHINRSLFSPFVSRGKLFHSLKCVNCRLEKIHCRSAEAEQRKRQKYTGCSKGHWSML